MGACFSQEVDYASRTSSSWSYPRSRRRRVPTGRYYVDDYGRHVDRRRSPSRNARLRQQARWDHEEANRAYDMDVYTIGAHSRWW